MNGLNLEEALLQSQGKMKCCLTWCFSVHYLLYFDMAILNIVNMASSDTLTFFEIL